MPIPHRPDPGEFLPLTPAVLHILLALSDEEQHGYGIMQEIEARTGGEVCMGSGTLYGTLKRLLEGGLVEESSARPDPKLDDERRRYYRLTRLGRKVIEAELARLQSILRTAKARRLLRGEALS